MIILYIRHKSDILSTFIRHNSDINIAKASLNFAYCHLEYL